MSMHLEHDWLVRYARGELDQARSFSVEAHLPACGDCRAAVASLVDTPRLTRTWDAIEDAIDTPPQTLVERVLVRAGVGESTARLLAVTPALRLSWLVAITAVMAIAVVSAHARGPQGVMAFLIVAPLLPLAGVAAAYGPLVDPAYELSLAAPLGSFRLLVLRAVAVVAVHDAARRRRRARPPGARLDGRGVAAALARPHARGPRPGHQPRSGDVRRARLLHLDLDRARRLAGVGRSPERVRRRRPARLPGRRPGRARRRARATR